MPNTFQKICVAIALAVVILFSAIVTVWGYEIFYDSFIRGRTTGSLLNLPVWIAEASVPVGFGLLTIQGVGELITLSSSGLFSLGASHE